MVGRPKKRILDIKKVSPVSPEESFPIRVSSKCPIEDPIKESVNELTKIKQTSAVSEDVPKAYPVVNLPKMDTAEALKTCVKFVGAWLHLVKGKPLTASKEAINLLRESGFVK